MLKFLIFFFIILGIIFLGCTLLRHTQWGTRHFGGSYDMEITPNQKLITIAWKDSNLWVLTKPMKKEDVAETYTLSESSNYGIFQGTVTMKEVKK